MRTPWALKKERATTETAKCFRRTDPAFRKIYCCCATLHYFFYCTFPCLGQCNADFPSQPTDVLLNCNSWTITLRCLSARVSETGALLHKTVIRAWQRFLCGLYVENMYTVLYYLEFDTGSGKFIVKIWNTTSFEITSNIRFYTENIPVGYFERIDSYSPGELV
jgi:hypothetical protein